MKQNICRPAQLTALLDGSLPSQELDHLTVHLEQCDACRSNLEKQAATPDRWQEVQTHLSGQKNAEQARVHQNVVDQTLPYTIRQVVGMLEPTDFPTSMGRIGGYEVIGVIGSGAMGVVLKAIDKALDRVVAIKVMNPTLAACGTARHRFAREAKAAAAVLHPNVIAIHGVSTESELPFLVMPYVRGSSLQQRIDREGPFELAAILRIGSQIADGLAAAHQKGLIHRDIKPSNVMLDDGVETALITDFGLARTIDDATMTRTGAITGTPEFMSPEQARGDCVDGASDVFSLGSLLYTLCTGTRPFRAKTTFGVLRKITDELPAPIREKNPDIPDWLCNLIDRLHAKSPQQRPSASGVHQLLTECLAHVYQPDRIPLPESLNTAHSPDKSFSIRTLLPGAITMLTLVIAALLFANAPFQNTSSTPIPPNRREPDVFKTHHLEFPDKTSSGVLVVDINRGFIEVEGHEGNEVLIEVLTPPRFKKKEIESESSEFQSLFTPQYDLDLERTTNTIKFDAYNQEYVLNLRIKVPYQTDMRLDSYRSGYIVAKNITGKVRSHSEHGDITLLNIAGSATAYSRNGNLKVQLTEISTDAELDYETYNGSIDLSLPKLTGLSTAISSGTSNTRTAFNIQPAKTDECPKSLLQTIQSNVEEYQFGTINGGGVPLRIESENGQITLRKIGRTENESAENRSSSY